MLDGSSTLTLQADSLQHLGRLFEQYLLSRTHQHGFLALPSHPADTASLLQLQFLFDVLQKTVSLKVCVCVWPALFVNSFVIDVCITCSALHKCSNLK